MDTHQLENKNWIVLTSHPYSSKEDDCACPDHGVVIKAQETGTNENDCACPDHGLHQAQYPVRNRSKQNAEYRSVKSPQMIAGKNLTLKLLNNYHLAFSPSAPYGPCVLNSAALDRLHAFQKPQPARSKLDLVLANERLIHQMDGQNTIATGLPQTFTAWLHITNECNLNCTYCYVPKSRDCMDGSVGLQALDQIFYTAKEHGFQEVKLKYAGGEPTLQFNLVQIFQSYATKLAQQSGLDLHAVVLSNGTCIQPKQAEWLLENNVKLMISMDGTGKVNDQIRPFKKSGKSSFSSLAHIVDQVLLPKGLQPIISITITHQNSDGISSAVRWALERDLPVNLNFYRQNNQSRSKTELNLEEETITQSLLKAYSIFEEFLPERPFLNGLLDRVQSGFHTQTCGVGSAYAVITHGGKLAQCQMDLSRARSIQNQEDLLPILQQGEMQNIPIDEINDCASCLFRYRCTGGCPVETYRVTGDWNSRSPNCRIYRRLYPEALRLEGLRLMKVNGLQH